MSTENDFEQYDATLLDKNDGMSAAVLATGDGNGWKKVVMGGSAGILLGTVGTLLTSATAHGTQDAGAAAEGTEAATEEEAAAANTTPTTNTTQSFSSAHPYADDTISIAEGVSDDMSFSQAFAAARAEVGAGGAFEWHGKVYGTYTADEWDAMSAAERAEYGSHFSWARHTNTYAASHSSSTDDNIAASATADVQTTAQEAPAASAPAVEVLGVVHDYDTGMNIAGVVVDGEPVALFDANGDGVINIGVADLNHDGVIQENEVADLTDEGLTVDDLGGISGYHGDPYADPYADNGDVALDDGYYEV